MLVVKKSSCLGLFISQKQREMNFYLIEFPNNWDFYLNLAKQNSNTKFLSLYLKLLSVVKTFRVFEKKKNPFSFFQIRLAVTCFVAFSTISVKIFWAFWIFKNLEEKKVFSQYFGGFFLMKMFLHVADKKEWQPRKKWMSRKM